MTKTIELQIEKCRTLIEGLRKNLGEVAAKGISAQELDDLEENLKKLSEASDECEAIRATLAGKVKSMNNILVNVKDVYASNKRKIKTNYPQLEWIKYGVIDKR